VVLPGGGEALEIVRNWCEHLHTGLLWGEDDALFPATQIGLGETGGFVPVGLRRYCWSNAGPVRTIFRTAFEGAACPISTRTASATRSCNLPSGAARRPKRSRRGHKTLGTSA
jgi:hypothetical protein